MATTNPQKPSNDGKFKPGHKFGKGRPQGSKSNAQLAIEEIGFEACEAAMKSIVKSALTNEVVEGDIEHCKFIVERCMPKRKDTRISVDLGFLDSSCAQSIAATLDKVFKGVCAGDISVEVGEKLDGMIKTRAELAILPKQQDEIAGLINLMGEKCEKS